MPLRLSQTLPVSLVRAAHPRQALATAAGLGLAAAVSGRPAREALLVAGTVLIGQCLLGWDNDLVDRDSDAKHGRTEKPLVTEALEPGTVWFTMACALLLVVPLAIASGTAAGIAYLVSLLVGFLGNRVLRGSVLSFLPWAISFGLYPAFLAYGGWGGAGSDTAPTVVMIVLFALLGIGVHVLRALPGLVHDNEDGRRSLPLRLALKTGAAKLMVIAGVYTALVTVAILIAGRAVGLT